MKPGARMPDPATVWRRKLRVGGHWWAERRDARWVRWSYLKADWEDRPGPPEGIRPLPPEAPPSARPPKPASVKPADQWNDWVMPMFMAGLGIAAILSVAAVAWNGIVGPFLGTIPISGIFLMVGICCVAALALAVVGQALMIHVGRGLREFLARRGVDLPRGATRRRPPGPPSVS